MSSSRRRRLVASAVAGGAIVLSGLVTGGVRAAADQHQNANLSVTWDFGGATGFWETDQLVRVAKKAPHSFWAMTWGYTEGGDGGGYLGLQTSARRPGGGTGDVAIFSLWNASAAAGPHCGRFDGEGAGYSCRVRYPVDTSAYYRYRVWRLRADTGGQWWGAWVQDTRTGVDTYIGSIRVAAAKTLMTPPRNFSEYWGEQVTCDAVPVSRAYFARPAADQQAPGVYEHLSRYAGSTRGDCTGGRVRVVTVPSLTAEAALTMMGGRR